MLSKSAISEFQKIWKEEYGEDITEKEAQLVAKRFLNFFAFIYKQYRIKDEKTY